jgi:protein-tyrosine phosphatase
MNDLDRQHDFDYSQITDYIYLGSDLCKGGVCLLHEEEFKKLGVSVEINLTREEKEFPPDNLDGYIWIPVIDDEAPTVDQLDLGTSIIDQSVKNKKVVYIHCRNGHGRSTTLLAAYFVRYQGMTVDEALAFIKSKRSEIHPVEKQIESLKSYIKRLS